MTPHQLPTITRLESVQSEEFRCALADVMDVLSRRVDAFAGTKATEATAANAELQATVDEAKAFLTGRYTAPTVTALSPTTGPAAGGTAVTITGTNFLGASAVMFGAVAATSYQIVSSTQIKAVAPAQAAGLVNVRVTNFGQSAIAAGNEYTYS